MNALFVQALQLQLNSCVFNTFISLSHPTAAAGDVTKCQQPAHKRSWTHFPFHRTMPFGLNFRRHVSAGFFCFSFFFSSPSVDCVARALSLSKAQSLLMLLPERAHTNIESLISEWSEKKTTTTTRHGKMCSEQLIASGRKKQQTFYCDPQNDTLCAVLYIK